MPNPIQQMIVNLILERPGRKHTLAGWAEALAASGQDLSARFAAAPDTEANRRLVSHITGIERWGVSRLGILLGAPLLQDKYDGYRPAQDLDWPAMQAAFAVTRAETVALIGQLAAAGIDDKAQSPHNQIGPLTAQGWLRYLHMHSTWEAKRSRE